MAAAPAELYLPDDCWECAFKFLINDNSCLKSLSVVSKQFLSITNRLRFSLTICYHTRSFLCRLLRRFPNLTSLDLSRYYGGDHDALLCQISGFPLKKLTSIKLFRPLNYLSAIPADGLRALSKNITTLTSIKFKYVHQLRSSDLFLFAECFPFLQELNLGQSAFLNEDDGDKSNFLEGMEALSLSLSKLRKINLSGHTYINDKILVQFFKNNKFLEKANLDCCCDVTYSGISSALRERPTLKSFSFCGLTENDDLTSSHFIDSLVSLKGLTCLNLYGVTISDELLSSIAMKGIPLIKLVVQGCIGYSYAGIFCLLSKCQSIRHLTLRHVEFFLNDQHVAELSLFLPNLVSINLVGRRMLTDSSLFTLVKNCPSIDSLRVCIEMDNMENSNSYKDFVVNHQLKSLYLTCSISLQDEHILKFASIFPNLEILNLWKCNCITEEGIIQVLMRCSNLRNLNLYGCLRVKLLGKNFEAPKLEVLNLSDLTVYDETLYAISKGCPGLLQLILQMCVDVTNKGVKYVVENCTQLRKIDLAGCNKVDTIVVASMVFSRPSLRKIIMPKRENTSSVTEVLSYRCFVYYL